jgi:hypothetical protein
VGDDELLGVQVSSLRVGFEVGEEVQDDSDRFLRPSSLGHSELSGLGGSAGGTCVSGVWNTSLVLQHLVQVLLGNLHSHALEDTGSVVRVLEVNTEVFSAGFDGCVRSTFTFFRVRWVSGVLLRHSFILIIKTDLNTVLLFPRRATNNHGAGGIADLPGERRCQQISCIPCGKRHDPSQRLKAVTERGFKFTGFAWFHRRNIYNRLTLIEEKPLRRSVQHLWEKIFFSIFII